MFCKSSEVEALCIGAIQLRLPRSLSGSKRGFHLCMAVAVNVANFSKWIHQTKAWAQCVLT